MKKLLMSKTKKLSLLLSAGLIAVIAIAADHIDAPAVKGGVSDITDFYAFQGKDTKNIVFVANLQGLLSPAKTSAAKFDENTLIEFNIDTNNDNIEDLVIQAIPRDGKMYFFGPVKPAMSGLDSTIMKDATQSEVEITTYGSDAKININKGMTFFAGPRDDPFFMDFARYGEIIGGKATGFNDPGTDTFKGTNVLSIVVEVPKSMIGEKGTINTWVESKSKK